MCEFLVFIVAILHILIGQRGDTMFLTAEQAREVMLYCHNFYNEPEVYIDKQIAEFAYNGKSEYIYNDILPLYLKDILEVRGYTVTEEWYDEEEGCRTHIMW